MPLDWESSKMTAATTSSPDAEAVQWSKCARNMLRPASAVDMTSMQPVLLEGYTKSKALILALVTESFDEKFEKIWRRELSRVSAVARQ